MRRQRKLVRMGATLLVLVAALASIPASLERLDGAAVDGGSTAALTRALGLDSSGSASPVLFASQGRTLTNDQRRALLEQAIAAAPMPLTDDPRNMSPRDASATALQQRLRSALARVVEEN